MKRLFEHLSFDPAPKFIGLVLIGAWLFALIKMLPKGSAFGLEQGLGLAVVFLIPASIIAIVSGLWYTPTYSRGGGPED